MNDLIIQPISFHATGLFLHPLMASENLWFSAGIERDQWHEMG